MRIRKFVAALALLTAGCTDPEAARRLEANIESMNERIKQAEEELKIYGKGSVVHDLIALRIAIHQQTLAMLQQRRAAEQWRTTLLYTVDGAPYVAPADLAARVATLQGRLKNTREGRESDLQLMMGSADSVRPLYITSIATKTVQIAQLEYQLAAYTNGFPPYYVPVSAPAKSATPQTPAGKAANAR
jgi:hypothetical protein